MIRQLFFIFILSIGIHITLNAQISFPEKCLGEWEGQMYMYSYGVLKDSVQLKFTVSKTSEINSFTWKTEYLSKEYPVVKDYILRLVDADKQTYVVDEGGGIELKDYAYKNTLYGIFETEGILITNSYQLIGDTLIFELTSSKKEENDKPVKNYDIKHLQTVVLKKKH